MWALVWLQLLANDGGVNYYHLGTYGNKDVCDREKEKALIIVENSNEGLACLELSRSK